MTKFQIYSHYKLPITKDPLKYGKLLDQTNNKFIIQLTTKNVAVINHYEKENFVRIFKNGDLVLEFRDKFINENSFIRTLNDTKFLFENDKLISTQILNALGSITIFNSDNNTPHKSNIINLLENTEIYKNKQAELFILFELFLIFLVYIIFFVIFPEDVANMSTTGFLGYNTVKLRKVRSRNIWKELTLNFGKKVYSRSLFENKFNKFWKNIQSGFNKNNNHLFILFKIKYVNGDFVTIGKLQRLNLNDKDWYINWIIDNMEFKSEYYNETQIESIIFSYGFKNEIIPNKNTFNLNVNSVVINNIKLPISMNHENYGQLSRTIDIENGELFILHNNRGEIIMFSKFNKFNEVEFLKNGNSLIKFKDEIISDNKFIRIIDNKKYYFENGKQFLLTKEMKSKFISKTSKSKTNKNNFITLDIETYIKNNILTPFCVSIYDGKKISNFYLTNYKNVDELIITALKSIMIRKYNGYNVYMHNMAKFDIIFLFKYFLKLGLVKPIIHNNRIILIDFKFEKYNLKFKDSLLLLVNSLSKLSKSFNVHNPKSVFPIFFVNENNLNYIGEVPDFKNFKNIKLEDYNNYKSKFNNNWNLRNECIKYCNLDCISLYQILFKFNNLIFDLFGENIHHYPTLPSLAFAIFKSNFMENENIPKLSGEIARKIREGYTGGATDMYIPKSKPGIKIKCLDVNSLYPYIMESRLMPIGVPTYFEGDVLKFDPNAFGFFYCKIIAPDDILHPILQTHVKTNNGTRTLAPIGTWEDMLFSEEMKNALKFGYQIEILNGYTFNSDIIFKDYVDFLYNLRSQYDKSNPLNFIAKILMNSLYGRFGMDDNFNEINIFKKDYYPDFENKYLDNIIKSTEIDDYIMVEFENTEKESNDSATCVAIAAAITAYSRIHMTLFKNNPKIVLYYTDTDSIYVDENSEIDPILVNEKILGKLKLEYVCEKAIFLSSKVYCLQTESGELIYKVKGLKHEIELTMNDFEELLRKDSLLKKSQKKLRKFLNWGHIEVLDQVYTLQVTDNKRKLIFDENKELFRTESYKISNSKNIKILPPFN